MTVETVVIVVGLILLIAVWTRFVIRRRRAIRQIDKMIKDVQAIQDRKRGAS